MTIITMTIISLVTKNPLVFKQLEILGLNIDTCLCFFCSGPILRTCLFEIDLGIRNCQFEIQLNFRDFQIEIVLLRCYLL